MDLQVKCASTIMKISSMHLPSICRGGKLMWNLFPEILICDLVHLFSKHFVSCVLWMRARKVNKDGFFFINNRTNWRWNIYRILICLVFCSLLFDLSWLDDKKHLPCGFLKHFFKVPSPLLAGFFRQIDVLSLYPKKNHTVAIDGATTKCKNQYENFARTERIFQWCASWIYYS